MNPMEHFYRFLLRFRYPVSLPEDVATAIGISIPKFILFNDFVSHLTGSTCRPTRLKRFMPRELAEGAFSNAQRKERFQKSSLYSFYFNEGWLEFNLQFDDRALLRRIYVHHKVIKETQGKEIALDMTFDFQIPETPSIPRHTSLR